MLAAVGVTLVFAALGTAGALVIGGGRRARPQRGGLGRPAVVAGQRRPAAAARVLVATRSIHELIWALLLVSMLGLDPLVAVLAIAVPFGAQTAKVFAETLDTVLARSPRCG